MFRLSPVFLGLLCCFAAAAQQNERCGLPQLLNNVEAHRPGARDAYFRDHRQMAAEAAQTQALARTQVAGRVPVVFHIVLTSAQVSSIGGNSGIAARIQSQIGVLNRDFNRQNPDSTAIPAGFKPYYGNGNIRFGLAAVDPSGNATSGFDVRVVAQASFSDINEGYRTAKQAATGLTPWDPTRYFNIWVINPSSSSLLGITIPPSFANPVYGFSSEDLGIVLNYGAFGVKSANSGYYLTGAEYGRTLTHETGHFFELLHTWGDDNGLCPNNGGDDDGISDTPPQANYSPAVSTYPRYDACTGSGNGVMFMNYMDYSDDTVMHMFTNMQASLMQQQAVLETHNLFTHSELLAVSDEPAAGPEVLIAPNPSDGLFSVTAAARLDWQLFNSLGAPLRSGTLKGAASLDFRGFPAGIYFIQRRPEDGPGTTRKIIIQ